MPEIIQCSNPACGSRYQASDSLIGRSVRCKACGHSFTAQRASTANPSKTSDGLPRRPGAVLPAAIDRFQIRKRLGAGAFGVVYRAHDPQLDREVAIKVPNPGVLNDPRRVERFLREARAAANLRHPNIVPVFDAGRDGESYYIAYAFIEGKPLEELVEEKGTEFRRSARLVRELAEALAYAHDQGIVHRDVKPANMLVDASDRVHLMDFGLAARRDEEGRLTNDGAVMGTPRYMAPEQAAGKSNEAGPAADQYAVGVVLYELMTGHAPFEGPPAVLLHQVVHIPPDPPSKSRPDTPRDLETICLKAMAKRPEDRFGTCHELAEDIRRWLDGEPIHARRAAWTERLAKWSRRNPLVAGLAASVAFLLTAGITVSTLLAVDAQSSAERADREAGTSKANAESADRESETARDNERKAELATIDAREQAKIARDEERAAREALYVARMNAIQMAWQAGNVGELRSLLDEAKPLPGHEDLRGFEWYYWHHTCRASSKEPPWLFPKVYSAVETRRIGLTGDGKLGACVVDGNKARVWEIDTGKVVRDFETEGRYITSVAFSPDNQHLAIAQISKTPKATGNVSCWRLQTGERLWTIEANAEKLVFSAVQDLLFVSCWDETVRFLAADSGIERGRVQILKKGFPQTRMNIEVSPDGKYLAVSVRGSFTSIWDIQSKEKLFHVMDRISGGKGGGIAFSPMSDRVAVANLEGGVEVWEIALKKQVLALEGHVGQVRAIRYSSDGKTILTGGEDSTIRIWSAEFGRPIRVLRGHVSEIHDLAISKDARRCICADGKSVRVWDLGKVQDRITPPISGPDLFSSGTPISD